MSQVNENIRTLRNRMGLTQERLAELVGINRKAVGAYEENRATPPLDKLNRMAELFGVTLDQLTQYRFTHDTPLFDTPESSIPAPSEPVATPVEKKKPFSRTGPPVATFEVLRERAVRYVSYKYFDRYVVDAEFQARLDALPAFNFPFQEEGLVYRAFDVPADSYLKEGIIIGEQIRLENLPSGRLLIVSSKRGIVLAKISLRADSRVEVKADTGEVFSLLPSEIREVWKPVGFFSRGLPAPHADLSGLATQFNALKAQFDALL